MDKFFKYPVMWLFAAFIVFFSAADVLSPIKEYSELENMYLSKPPKFSFSAILDSTKNGYAQKYEKFTNEQFLFRDKWITIKSVSESALGKIENNGIVYGDDKYMFDKFKSFDQERYDRNVSILSEFAGKNPHIKKTLMIAPSAYSIMPERVPIGLGNIDQLDSISKLYDALVPFGWEVADVATALFNFHRSYPESEIYYRTDHHWTTQGAYIAYQNLLESKGILQYAFNWEDEISVPGFYGTHYSKCKLYNAKPDNLLYFDVPFDSFIVDGEQKDSLYDGAKLESRDKYGMFLYGNNGLSVLQNHDAPEKETIMIIKDSFANCLIPFLSQTYEEVVIIDLRSLPTPLSEVIAQYNPKEIIMVYNYKNLIEDSDLPRLKY